MHPTPNPFALLAPGVFVLIVAFAWSFMLSIPVFCWVLVRNVVKGRRALERIAAQLESAPASNGRGVLGL